MSPSPAPPSTLIGRLRTVLVGGRAMVLSTATKLWQLAAGLFSSWLYLDQFGPELRGLYFTFASLLAIQTLFDLGLTGVLASLAAREWPAAADENAPNQSLARRRIGGLLRRSGRWFGGLAIAFAVVAIPTGLLLLDQPDTAGFAWRGPWCVACVVTAAALWLMPSVGVLEGRYVVAVNAFRLGQALLGNAVVWTIILLGGELWALVGSAVVRLVCEAVLVLGVFGKRLAALRRTEEVPADDALDWNRAVQPLQWRIALQSLALYFGTQTYTIIITKTQSVAAAGRMGMTWTVLVAIQAAGWAWFQSRMPLFGAAIAEGRIADARKLLRQTIAIVVATQALGLAVFVALLLGLEQYRPAYRAGFLDLPTTLLFGVSLIVQTVQHAWSAYVRLFRIDPFVRPGLIGSGTLAVAALAGGTLFGAPGIAVGHLITMTLVNSLLLTPVIRRELAVAEPAAVREAAR